MNETMPSIAKISLVLNKDLKVKGINPYFTSITGNS